MVNVDFVRLFSFLCCVVFLYLLVFVLYIVYPILSVSLNCQFLIAPLVFSNVYFINLFYNIPGIRILSFIIFKLNKKRYCCDSACKNDLLAIVLSVLLRYTDSGWPLWYLQTLLTWDIKTYSNICIVVLHLPVTFKMSTMIKEFISMWALSVQIH